MEKKETKRPRGRPDSLTPEIQEKICRALKKGSYIETAAKFSGITKKTLYEWMKRGNDQNSGKFRNFLNAVNKAMAEGELVHVERVDKASETDWKASSWMLERKFPKRWGRRDTIKNVEGDSTEFKDDGENIQDKLVELIEDLDGK